MRIVLCFLLGREAALGLSLPEVRIIPLLSFPDFIRQALWDSKGSLLPRGSDSRRPVGAGSHGRSRRNIGDQVSQRDEEARAVSGW